MSQLGIDDCRDIFSLYDRVGDNKIRVEQLGEVLRALGSNPTESEVVKLRQQFKIGKDVRISFETFWSIFQARKPRVITPGKVPILLQNDKVCLNYIPGLTHTYSII